MPSVPRLATTVLLVILEIVNLSASTWNVPVVSANICIVAWPSPVVTVTESPILYPLPLAFVLTLVITPVPDATISSVNPVPLPPVVGKLSCVVYPVPPEAILSIESWYASATSNVLPVAERPPGIVVNSKPLLPSRLIFSTFAKSPLKLRTFSLNSNIWLASKAVILSRFAVNPVPVKLIISPSFTIKTS